MHTMEAEHMLLTMICKTATKT